VDWQKKGGAKVSSIFFRLLDGETGNNKSKDEEEERENGGNKEPWWSNHTHDGQ